MDAYWKAFVEEYVNNPFYWFQPKGCTVSPETLREIQSKLKLLKRYARRPWRRAQAAYTAALRDAGLYRPRKRAMGRDSSAIARMNKMVFDSLGVAWITDESIVEITEAGQQFLRLPVNQLSSFVAQQLRRYEIPNPGIGQQSEGAGVFPHSALLAVLTHFPGGIPSECYELFISRIRSQEDRPRSVEHIERYLRLKPQGRSELCRALDRIPILKEGRIQIGARRTSLFHTIHLNRSYMVGFLQTPGLVTEGSGKLKLAPGRHAEAEALVQDHLANDCYIRFATAEDWTAFYGQPQRRPTFEEALIYYRHRGDIARSTEIFQRARARRRLPDELQVLDEKDFRRLNVLEKTLEDFLEFNLDILESGLKFVGRQYPTSTGPLDILAKDARGRWVVVELKRGRAADRVIGQLLRYRAFIISERAGSRDDRVRGFVVAPDPDRRLTEAARGAAPVPLEVFRFEVKGDAKRLFPPR